MGHVCLPMLLSSVDFSSRDYIDSEAGGPVNPSQNDPSLILRVYLHYRYNYMIYFEPRRFSLIGVNLYMHRSDLGRAFAGIRAETIPHLDVE